MSEVMPFISVIIPFYNTGELIQVSVKSLISQTNKNFEVIFINDGSSDDTRMILDELLVNTNLNYRIIDKVNEGVSAARNDGLSLANGEYIYFFDADDIVAENIIEQFVVSIKNTPDLVVFGHDVVDKNLNVIHSHNVAGYDDTENGRRLLLDCLFRRIVMSTESVLLNKGFIEHNSLSYSVNLKFGEDQEYNMLALYHADKVNVLNEQLVLYVKHDGSATTLGFTRDRYGYIDKFDKLINCIDTDDELLGMVYQARICAMAYICTLVFQSMGFASAMKEVCFLKTKYLSEQGINGFNTVNKRMYILMKFFPGVLYVLLKSGRFRRIWFTSIFNFKS